MNVVTKDNNEVTSNDPEYFFIEMKKAIKNAMDAIENVLVCLSLDIRSIMYDELEKK